jgi:hypothetical protein
MQCAAVKAESEADHTRHTRPNKLHVSTLGHKQVHLSLIIRCSTALKVTFSFVFFSTKSDNRVTGICDVAIEIVFARHKKMHH